MKQLVTAIALSCVLSTAVLAGEIPSVGITAPRPAGTTTTATSPGDIPSGGSAVTGDVPTVGSAVTASDVLNLLQTVFGLM